VASSIQVLKLNIVFIFHLPKRATLPAHLILLDLITLITVNEVYNLWNSFVK